MKLAPAQWTGSARTLIQNWLQPQFLPAPQVEAWHHYLERRLAEADPIYVLEAATPEQRSRLAQEQIFLTRTDSRILFGDRSPAVGVMTYLAKNDAPTTEKMAALFMHLPFHSFDLDKFTRWAASMNSVASAGWMVAAIFGGVKADASWENLSREELKRMTVRNLHPLNMFLFPNLNKSGRVFADDPRFHALIAESYENLYGPLWTSFLASAQVDPSTLPAPVDFELDFNAKVPTGGLSHNDNRELISKIQPQEAYDLKLLTVSEKDGYHSRLLEPSAFARGLYDVKLEFRDKSGTTKTVGFYRLNLKELYERNFIARDAKGIRLLVHHTEGDHFAVGPKKSGPLTRLPSAEVGS